MEGWKMNKTVNSEIKNALTNKGYKWENINIKHYLGYTHLYEIKLDGKLVEIYDTRRKCFID